MLSHKVISGNEHERGSSGPATWPLSASSTQSGRNSILFSVPKLKAKWTQGLLVMMFPEDKVNEYMQCHSQPSLRCYIVVQLTSTFSQIFEQANNSSTVNMQFIIFLGLWFGSIISTLRVQSFILLLILSLKLHNVARSFACGSVWVWNLVSDIKGGTQTVRVWEQDVEENIWTEERWSDRRMEKTTEWRAS
jgi:hypothetical protein